MTFICKRFTGYYPVPVAAVVQALSACDAATMLNESLREAGLPGDASHDDMVEFEGGVVVLSDGNY